MSQDNELFNLCKEVYKRTEWKDTSDVIDFYQGKYTVQQDCSGDVDPFKNGVYWSPLYTSDYLLEKLPRSISNKRDIHMDSGYLKGEEVWRFAYDKGERYYVSEDVVEAFGDTSLKALLKLVIALDDAKELK